MEKALTKKEVRSGTPIEIWFQDEARVGQKNGLVYQWAERGSRPRQARDQRYENAYIFGAICPARDVGAALILPHADGWAMQQHLDEISRHVVTGAHAVVLLDQAGWHTTDKLMEPANITMLPLPPKSPELNAQENIWQYLRQNFLSNRVFASYEAIHDACQHARSSLTDEAGRIAKEMKAEAKKAEEVRRLAEAKAAGKCAQCHETRGPSCPERSRIGTAQPSSGSSIFPRPQSNQSQLPFLIGHCRGRSHGERNSFIG